MPLCLAGFGVGHLLLVRGEEEHRDAVGALADLAAEALGLFERGWNASPAWEGTEVSDDPAFVRDFNAFYSIIYDKELPYYQERGIAYHIN